MGKKNRQTDSKSLSHLIRPMNPLNERSTGFSVLLVFAYYGVLYKKKHALFAKKIPNTGMTTLIAERSSDGNIPTILRLPGRNAGHLP